MRRRRCGSGQRCAAGCRGSGEARWGRALSWTPSLPRGHVQPPSRRRPTTMPARELPRPPRLRERLQPLQPWATDSRDPWRISVASAHFLIKRFYGFFFFLLLWIFFPSPKKVIIQMLLKILFALKLPLHNFFLVKKGTLRANQAQKYSVFPYCYLAFSISFFKHNYQNKKSLRGILPIKMNRRNKNKKLKPDFVHLKDTNRVFMPCLTGSRRNQHLFEVLIWALAFTH